MPRYFFNIADAGSRDARGEELADLAAAKCHAVKYAGDLICDAAKDFWDKGDWRMTVTDDNGLILFELHFFGVESAAISSPK